MHPYAYQIAKYQIAEFQKTANQTRPVRSDGAHHAVTNARRLISGVISRVSAAFTMPRDGQGSHTASSQPRSSRRTQRYVTK